MIHVYSTTSNDKEKHVELNRWFLTFYWTIQFHLHNNFVHSDVVARTRRTTEVIVPIRLHDGYTFIRLGRKRGLRLPIARRER